MSEGFPAHAGMDPVQAGNEHGAGRLPRTRGDGPPSSAASFASSSASPHTRGWTCAVGATRRPGRGFPAHAGMDQAHARGPAEYRRLPRTRGDGPDIMELLTHAEWASPHTRGWTRRLVNDQRVGQGFPAHAGMDPQVSPARRTPARLPRTRGDGPSSFFPREEARAASPHTRGWTRSAIRDSSRGRGFPAHAGMDPRSSTPRRW